MLCRCIHSRCSECPAAVAAFTLLTEYDADAEDGEGATGGEAAFNGGRTVTWHHREATQALSAFHRTFAELLLAAAGIGARAPGAPPGAGPGE